MERKDYPRVSNILSLVKDFSGIDAAVLKAKANDGTIVHKAINDHLLGNEPIFLSPGFDTMSQEERIVDAGRAGRRFLYFKSFMVWFEELRPTLDVHEDENRLYDDTLKYSGAIDGLCYMPHTQIPTLIDFKTSAQEDTLCWPLQGHMYHQLLEKNNPGKLFSNRMIFLRLSPLGKFPFVHTYEHMHDTWQYCKELISQYHEKISVVH